MRVELQRSDAPKVSTTDFYQVGTSHNLRRFSLSTDSFLINRSNEEVYIPDDGSFEFEGPSCSYGWGAMASMQTMRHLALNGGFTQVSNAFYLGSRRVHVNSAPHSVANSSLMLSNWHGFNSSLRYRHISGYILDGSDPNVPRATSLDVMDLNVPKGIRHGLDFNFAIDNLNTSLSGKRRIIEIPSNTSRPGEVSRSRHARTSGRPDYRVRFGSRETRIQENRLTLFIG
jgi:hypothetical protein